MATVKSLSKANKTKVFRRAYVKRRLVSTGLFETDWQEISEDIKRWGTIKSEVDTFRASKFRLSTLMLKVANDDGRYNPETDDASLWFGYASRERSLVKIEAGYVDESLGADGIWVRNEFPTDTTAYVGVMSGEILLNDQNSVTLRVKPLTQVFREFPAQLLTGWTSTGITASDFIFMLRDMTDGSSNYLFRPFFGDTTSNWNVSTTTVTYSDLNTSSAKDIIDANCWQVIQKLAESENFVPYVSRSGVFNFGSKTSVTATTAWEFYGINTYNTEYGNTIKKIKNFGFKKTNYYSRVSVRYVDTDTETSYSIVEATMAVAGDNAVWNLGHRILNIENFWIPNTVTADALAQTIFDDASVIRNHLEFTTSFIPQIEILDRIEVSYDSADKSPQSRWDFNNWSPGSDELYWDDSRGDSLVMSSKAFKILSAKINLDKMECDYIVRELDN